MKLTRAFLAVFLLLLLSDWIAAYGSSRFFTRELLRAANERIQTRVVFSEVRVHPLFLSVSAEDIEIFDPDSPHLRVLYGRRVRAQADPWALFLEGKIYLSRLQFEKFEMKVIKDVHGVLNVEKILEPEPAPPAGPAESMPTRFHGSIHQDWFFNWYERIKFAVKRPPTEFLKGKPLFQIQDLRLTDGTMVLADRTAKPVVFHGIHLQVKNLRWFRSGAACLDSIYAGGELKTSRKGYFDISIRRKRQEIRVLAKLRDVDLKFLKPIYIKTSPVYFEKGFITWASSSRFSADRLDSTHRIRIDAHVIRSTVGWSQESDAVIRALNRHARFGIDFKITGPPDHLSFPGFGESLANVLKKDFNKPALAVIRHRTNEELDKLANRLA